MNVITQTELQQRLSHGEDFKLVQVTPQWAYDAKHIPTALHIDPTHVGDGDLGLDDDIVIYDGHEACPMTYTAYNRLKAAGYSNISVYPGGIADWEEAGGALEGEWAA